MAHLDADVAAFVDGQLSPDATEAAARHVQDCAACREAVAQQRHLKLRMQASADVRPPASLVASLATLLSSDTSAAELLDSSGRDDDAVLALNIAYAVDGAVIDIAPKAKLDRPVLVVALRATADPSFVATRNVVRVGEGAEAQIRVWRSGAGRPRHSRRDNRARSSLEDEKWYRGGPVGGHPRDRQFRRAPYKRRLDKKYSIVSPRTSATVPVLLR